MSCALINQALDIRVMELVPDGNHKSGTLFAFMIGERIMKLHRWLYIS